MLDFAFQYRAKDVFVYNKGTDNLEDLFNQDVKYNDHNSSADYLMNFVSNHDVGRIGYSLDQEMPSVSIEERMQRALLANSLMYFTRGVPVIYYGEEQGFTGDGGDRGAREDMMPSLTPDYNDNVLYGTTKTTAQDNFDTSHPMYQKLAEYASIYHRHEALRKGTQKVVYSQSTPGIFVATRQIDGQMPYFVIYNSSKSEQSYTLPVSAEKELDVVYGTSQISGPKVTLAPLSFVIVK